MLLFNFFKKKKQGEVIGVTDLQEQMINDICYKTISVAPKSWESIHVFISVTDGSCIVNFLVKNQDGIYEQGHDLEKKLNVKISREITSSVWDIFDKLPKKDKWKIMFLDINKNGSFIVNYDYLDKIKDDEIFEYQLKAENEWLKKFINK